MMTMKHLSGTPHLRILNGLIRTPSFVGNHVTFTCAYLGLTFHYYKIMN